MFFFWRDLVIAFIGWSCSVYAEKRLAIAMFIEPRNYSDWLMLLMFEPITLLVSGSLIIFGTYMVYRVCRRHVYWLLVRRVFPGMERMIHLALVLFGVFLLFILGSKFPWVAGIGLCGFLAYDVAQIIFWHTRDS